MIYKDYTIIEDQRNPYRKPEFMFYITDDGIQHDADYDGESFKYTGNCKWADSLEEAKEEIEELIEKRFTDVHGCIDHSALNIANKYWDLLKSKS